MAALKFNPKGILESLIPSTAIDGDILFTDKGSMLVATSTGTLIRFTDIIFVNSLPNSGQLMNKFYCLSTNGTINTYDGTGWKSWGSPSFVLPVATTTTLGGIKIGDGLIADSNGLTSAKLGTGLALDASKNIIVDTNNVDITQLHGFSTLVLGSPKGFFDTSATLATFTSGTKGDFWIYTGTTSLTLGGLSFSTNDQLWVKTAFTGAPTDLTTNHVKVPYTLVQASITTAGAVKLGSATPLMDATTAVVGTAVAMSREDHVHPSDTSKISKIASSTNNAIVTWSGTTGLVLSDSTKLLPVGTIVGNSDTQTLTNKSLSSNTTTIIDTTDATKVVKFDASGITTATTRTLIIPNKSGTIAIAPSVVTLSVSGNVTLAENTIYEVNNLAVKDSVLTLPTGTATGNYIQIIVAVTGFDDSHTFLISGTINGATNTIVNNRSFVEYKFYYSASTSNWILASSTSGY